MRARMILTLAALCFAATFALGQRGPGAQPPRSAGSATFSGQWVTDAAMAFINGGARPSVAGVNGAVLVDISVDSVDSRRANGVVTEFLVPLCDERDSKLPFSNGVINGRTITFTVTRPAAGDCPPRAGGNGTAVGWSATLSDDEQTLIATRGGAAGGRGQGGPGGGNTRGTADTPARGASGPAVNSPGGTLAPPIGPLTPAVPALGPAVSSLGPAVSALQPAVPALGPSAANANTNGGRNDRGGRGGGNRDSGNRGGGNRGGDRGGGGTIVMRRLSGSLQR